jgi:hypothetical protein
MKKFESLKTIIVPEREVVSVFAANPIRGLS